MAGRAVILCWVEDDLEPAVHGRMYNDAAAAHVLATGRRGGRLNEVDINVPHKGVFTRLEQLYWPE